MIGGAKGIGIGIDFGIPNQYCRATSKPYIEKDVLDSLRVVASAYGKSNDDADRSIVKNLVDASNPFIISNAAFKLNSGFGKYEEDFTDWRVYPNIKVTDSVVTTDGNFKSSWFIYKHSSENKINEMNIKVSGIPKGGKILYFYISDETANLPISYTIPKDGIYHLPESKINNNRASVGFTVESSYDWNNIRIEQIPSFEGAFVTDGINDLITSTKTVQEMLGGSNEITVVSMIHQVKDSANNVSFTNYIRGSANGYFRNIVNNYDKTGIYGYTSSDLMGLSVVNNILGDKNDYTANGDNRDSIINGNFSVQGYSYNDGNNTGDFSSVAWYWTIIANKVLTTDQINQVIAYFNLDRTLKSDIYCNIAKQGITNENHAEFGDKLIDFSGNGRDIQLNNIAWDGDSGIGKYNYPNWKVTATIANTYSTIVNYPTVNGTYSINVNGVSELMQSIGLHLEIKYTTSTGIIYNDIKQDGVYSYILPDGATDLTLRFGGIPGIVNEPCNITITQIPSHAGALYLDGVSDFGQFVGDLGLKDYTFIADRAYDRIVLEQAPFIASKSTNGQAPFLMEYLNSENYVYPHSFGATTKTTNLNIQRQISYQSTYVYNGNSISKGTSVDTGDGLTIGNSGSTGLQYSPLCLWSLMLFPYSMSEFLIERQLKKHKLGTLYPNMVEFRPVIKSSVELASKPTFVIRGTSTLLNTGDYIPENSEIWVVITMNNAADRITKFVINGNTIDIPSSAYNPSTMKYGFPFTIDSKSPQKITMTIEQDENYVKFEPVITSNVEYVRLDFYLNNYQKRINIGDYIPKDAYLRANLYLKNNVDELTVFTFNGVNIGYRRSSVDDMAFNINQIYNYDSPQEVNITIDEYIRYEDIVQPYPVLLRFKDENGNEVSWGGKFKVGSTITRIGSIADPESNLLNGLYSISGLSLNGKAVTSSTSIVEKQMVFKTTATYLLDNNEPKCILSPSRLRIPNSSYKILGCIPDISGHGNHGKINNSAYAGASGANGYLQNFSEWTKASGVSSTDSVISSSNNLVAANGWIAYVTSGTVIPTFKVEISGIPVNGNLRFEGSGQTLVNGVNTIQGITTTKVTGFYISSGYDNDWSNLKIEQIGEYEGAYCLDGVDDFVTIPTVTGGKQVLMKVNWDSSNSALLYDQRGYNNEFAIYNGSADSDGNPIPAYSGRNNGQTYIDGILNSNIKASELRAITHNITITNELSAGVNKFSPVIGSHRLHNAYFVNMALYDFMLFDEISTDNKIKELNEYVGIEAKVELPPYYWDTYGKTNLDADKATIQQRGVAVGDYDLTNTNFAYDKMSGFGGYEFEKFTDTTKWIETKREDGIEVIEKNDYSFTAKKVGTGQYFWDFKNNSIKTLDRDLTVKAISNNNVYIRWEFKYRTAENPDIDSAIVLVKQAMTPNVPITVTLPYKTEEEQAELGVVEGSAYYLFYFDPSDIPVNEEYTVEMLPLYPNGLVYDGVTDYSENVNIPTFNDFTLLVKASLLNGFIGSGGSIAKKGNNNKVIGGGYDFIYALDSSTIEDNRNSYWSFGAALRVSNGAINPPLIGYMTKNNVNGVPMSSGASPSIEGITFSKWEGYIKMVLYKAMLYPKTIPLLQINFLKNLMEKDEIIDLTNPIFIK